MEKNLNISIIIPGYNCEKTIEACLDSVLRCPYSGYEVIVVDDGSTDDTRSILKEKYMDRILLLEQENAGASAARNNGIQHATKDHILFLDSDDFFCDGWWECLGEYQNFDVVLYDYQRRMKGECRYVSVLSGVQASAISEINKTYVLSDALNAVCAKIYNRQFLINNEILFPTSMSRAVDAYFFGNVLEHTKSLIYYPKAFYIYDNNPNSITHHKPNHLDNEEQLFTFKKNFLTETGCGAYEKQFYEKFLGDFFSRLRQSTDTYERFYSLVRTSKKYDYVKELTEYHYEQLSVRRRLQLWCLKNGLFAPLFLEMKLENLMIRR